MKNINLGLEKLRTLLAHFYSYLTTDCYQDIKKRLTLRKIKKTSGRWASQVRKLSVLSFLGIFILAFLIWSAFFDLDQTVRANGSVIASSRTQVIQALDGGMLSDLRVHEGQIVKAGDVLAVLEPARAQAGFQESQGRVAALSIALVRAKAQFLGKKPEFAQELASYPDFISAQTALYIQRDKNLKEGLAPLMEALEMAQEELSMNEDLYKTGDVSRVEVLRAKRQVSELQSRVSQVKNQHKQETAVEVAKLEEELMSSRYKLAERKDVFDNTRLSSPVDGVVKVLKISTVGGVLRPGDEIMQISPVGDSMVIEVKITPADVGQIKVGMPASVKVDAYDYGIYGALDGELIYISPDVLVEQGPSGQTQTYYRAHIRLYEKQNNPRAAMISLKLGMTGTVDVRTGSRSVFRYLTKPIFKSFSGALNER
jgi:adhesin transport system membrane fusion protein